MDTRQSSSNSNPWLAPIPRRKFMKLGWQVLAAFTGSSILAAGYGYGWERKWLEVKRVSIALPGIPEPFHGTKLIQFSDIHLDHYFDTEDLKQVVDVIAKESPDMICFTGDLVEDRTRSLSGAIQVLSQLQAPLGKYAVLGNHDYRSGEQSVVRSALSAAGFEVLDNRNVRVDKEGSTLYVAGVDDVLFGVPDLSRALYGVPHEKTVILLAHEPDFADEAASYPIHLQLSGHSHGGQVRLPIVGHVLTPILARKYVQGLYEVGPNKMLLYTNRGVGTTQLPIRFLCRPEITVMTLT